MITQMQLEDQFSRRNIRKIVLEDIDSTSEVFQQCINKIIGLLAGEYYESKIKRLKECKLNPQDIAVELFIAVLPIIQISPFQSVVAQLGNRLGYKYGLDGVRTASEIVAVCEVSGLYTIYHSSDDNNKTGTLGIRANYRLSDKARKFIDQTMYMPPMIEQPKPWVSNSEGGHLQGSGSVILGSMNHHNEYQALESLNILQNIAWEINEHIMNIEETPNKQLDTDKKQVQFERFKDVSHKVYTTMVASGNKFWFPWKNDKRGRQNCLGYHVTLQGTEYKKALIQFNQKELLT